MQKQLPKREFVATIVYLFFITNIIKTVSFLYIDIIEGKHIITILMCAPLIILGGICGNFINKIIDVRIFRLIVILLIAGMGMEMLIR